MELKYLIKRNREKPDHLSLDDGSVEQWLTDIFVITEDEELIKKLTCKSHDDSYDLYDEEENLYDEVEESIFMDFSEMFLNIIDVSGGE